MKTETYLISFIIIIFAVFGLFYVIQQSNRQKTSKDQEDKIVINTQPIKQNTPMPTPKSLNPPSMQIDENKIYTALMKTSVGDITIELNAKQTPKTVNNFVYLAKKGFYNNTIFHRVIKNFMIQGGDPTGTGKGDPGYRFADEPFEGDYTRGTMAMANAGPNTNGSQFFIMHQNNDLPKNYVIFGKVVEGMETVDKIAEAPVTTNTLGEPSKPVNPVKILSVEISEK